MIVSWVSHRCSLKRIEVVVNALKNARLMIGILLILFFNFLDQKPTRCLKDIPMVKEPDEVKFH